MIGVESGWAGAQAAYDYLWPFIGEQPDLGQGARSRRTRRLGAGLLFTRRLELDAGGQRHDRGGTAVEREWRAGSRSCA